MPLLVKTPKKLRQLMAALADVLLIVEGREANRAAFPWNALSTLLLTNGQVAHALSLDVNGTFFNTTPVGEPSIVARSIDYSGKGMWITYSAMATFEFRLPASYGIYAVHLKYCSIV